MKYSLLPKELNGWKARIGERLVEFYIQREVISKIKKEGWSDGIYREAWFYTGDEIFEKEEKFFVAHGLFPTSSFLKRFEKLTKLLKNIPDGFLIKWKETGQFKSLEDALKELGLRRYKKRVSWDLGKHSKFDSLEHDMNEQLPVVDGEVEVIEVKTGSSANLPPHQKRSYGNILREGYVLRFFLVNIISLNENEFETEQKFFSHPTKLKSFPLKKKRTI